MKMVRSNVTPSRKQKNPIIYSTHSIRSHCRLRLPLPNENESNTFRVFLSQSLLDNTNLYVNRFSFTFSSQILSTLEVFPHHHRLPSSILRWLLLLIRQNFHFGKHLCVPTKLCSCLLSLRPHSPQPILISVLREVEYINLSWADDICISHSIHSSMELCTSPPVYVAIQPIEFICFDVLSSSLIVAGKYTHMRDIWMPHDSSDKEKKTLSQAESNNRNGKKIVRSLQETFSS